ncbi:unnamed protein product [Sympodiomycopsis kandeliae]
MASTPASSSQKDEDSPLLSQSQPQSRSPLSHTRPDPPRDRSLSHHLPASRGFQNPWPSWTKPSLYEMWSGLSWNHQQPPPTSISADPDQKQGPQEEIRDTLDVIEPDFSSSEGGQSQIKTWWLGHAGVLVEYPVSTTDGEPLRVLFDPIFSLRCSPTQYVGPTRFYPSPIQASSLPRVDLILISHNHYDHLDAETISELWKLNADHLQFIVPLGNRSWFQSLLGIDDVGDRILECDWWDELLFTSSDWNLKVATTPAQHGSGRMGLDIGSSLWCSYTIQFDTPSSSHQLFFGGDTGYQLQSHPSSNTYPKCPAFQEIYEKYGPSDLLLLPISVGSTYSYLKSWDYVGLLPEIDNGLLAQNHLNEREAVEVAKILSGNRKEMNIVAIHFGTFSPVEETRRNIRNLITACQEHHVQLVRSDKAVLDISDGGKESRFYVLDHGGRVDMDLRAGKNTRG